MVFWTFFEKTPDFFKRGIKNFPFRWVIIVKNEDDYIF